MESQTVITIRKDGLTKEQANQLVSRIKQKFTDDKTVRIGARHTDRFEPVEPEAASQ